MLAGSLPVHHETRLGRQELAGGIFLIRQGIKIFMREHAHEIFSHRLDDFLKKVYSKFIFLFMLRGENKISN